MKLDRGSRTQFCWYLTLVHPPSAGGWWGKRGSWLVVPGVNSRKLRLLRLHWMTLTCTAPLSSESVVSLGFLLICWQLQYCNVVLHIRQCSTQKALDISLKSALISTVYYCNASFLSWAAWEPRTGNVLKITKQSSYPPVSIISLIQASGKPSGKIFSGHSIVERNYRA